jgi:hypothetical protein
MEECLDMRFGTVAHNSTKAYGKQLSCQWEAWGFFQSKVFAFGPALYHSCSLECKHQVFGESFASFLDFIVWLKLYLSTQKEEEKSFWFLYNETCRPLDISTVNEC